MSDSDPHPDGSPSPPGDWNELYSGTVEDYEAPDPDLIEIAARLPPGRALDVGCGAGGLLAALGERGWQLTGIDVAARAIEAARAVLEARALEAELTVADAASWEPSSRYDLVTSSFALPEGEGRRSALGAIRAAVAPGGTVAVKEFDRSMTRFDHFAGFDLITLEELEVAFAGFEIARLEVVATPVHEHAGESHSAEGWTAALLEARLRNAR